MRAVANVGGGVCGRLVYRLAARGDRRLCLCKQVFACVSPAPALAHQRHRLHTSMVLYCITSSRGTPVAMLGAMRHGVRMVTTPRHQLAATRSGQLVVEADGNDETIGRLLNSASAAYRVSLHRAA